jgi:hypothetical protein
MSALLYGYLEGVIGLTRQNEIQVEFAFLADAIFLRGVEPFSLHD